MYKIYYVKESQELSEIVNLGIERKIKIDTEKVGAYNTCKLGDLYEISSGAEEPYVFKGREYLGDLYTLKKILTHS